MRVDSSKVSQMAIAEFSHAQKMVNANSVISRKVSHKESTKDLISEDIAI